MTDFEAFANELNVKIETDKNGLYTGMCGVLASICTEVILSDDETIFNLSWDEQKEKEHGVTNEELLKHLKELEIAQSCVLNGINSLFSIINSKSELLQLDDKQKGSLELVMIATVSMTKDMMEISGMNKRIER